MNADHVGFLFGGAALSQLHAKLCKHFRRGELTNIIKIGGVVGRLQTYKVNFGVALKTSDVEVNRNATGLRQAGTDQ